MKPGDLFGTGTISGTDKESLGCLLEMTWGGKNPIKFGEGTRTFLQDGDVVTMRGTTHHGVGFGECVGKVLPALPMEEYIWDKSFLGIFFFWGIFWWRRFGDIGVVFDEEPPLPINPLLSIVDIYPLRDAHFKVLDASVHYLELSIQQIDPVHLRHFDS